MSSKLRLIALLESIVDRLDALDKTHAELTTSLNMFRMKLHASSDRMQAISTEALNEKAEFKKVSDALGRIEKMLANKSAASTTGRYTAIDESARKPRDGGR